MNRIVFIVFVIALGFGVFFFKTKRTADYSELPQKKTESDIGKNRDAEPASDGTADGTTGSSNSENLAPSAVPSTEALHAPTKGKTALVELPDGVDGNLAPSVAQGEDVELPPKEKLVEIPVLAGVKNPRVWFVASDLVKVAPKGEVEVGNGDGSKALPWKNRAGKKFGDGVRVKGGATATLMRGLITANGVVDAVAICSAGAKDCVNSAPSQIKLGMDLNHPESWIAGVEMNGKSPKGGGSFTALFVAARGSRLGNPLMENQNGEAGATKGPFLGWIGPDLVGSIHGLQGIVGVNAVSIPNSWTDGIHFQIYTLRFDRKKSELKLYIIAEKGSSTQAQAIEKGDGPDNDQYAAIAMGSKNPGEGALTYVLEAAAYPRALKDSEICAIHKKWNQNYSLKVSPGEMKACGL